MVDYLTQPLLWVFALLLTGLLLHKRKPAIGHRLLWGALLAMLCMGWAGPPEWIIKRLESQYAEIPLDADLRGYVGVVVLGGATESGALQQAHIQPLLNGAAERMTAPLAMLVTAYPVDFLTGADTPCTNFSFAAGAGRWELVAHELVGLVGYRLRGWL